ncbi:MAG: transcriptional repressor [Kineosporiaceae bacterium]|nr:transcriptional repressor [Kineosporiaceae bacterium]MBK7623193.1 transcriptional repressor [Kineosporiaceae bacterium]MBK8074855.1 transcriptional repressor [Kineosporiaceae bacterium]
MLGSALRARGLRATTQRRLVADAVVALGHATPEQVCERVQQSTPGLSLSTVYRTLELLEELGVVTHTHLTHGASTYHARGDEQHIHLVCHRCGAVAEADAALAVELAAAVLARHGFVTDLSHLSLHGLCVRCASTEVVT